MDAVKLADLCEPGAHTFHHSAARLETVAPVGFPLEEVTGKKGVGAEFKDTAEFAGGGGRPERELLHEVGAAGCYEAGEFVCETVVQRGGFDLVEGLVVTGVFSVPSV